MSSQNIRYTSIMPASEIDHSNFRIYTLSLPTGSFAVIKRGVYKSSLFIFHRELYSMGEGGGAGKQWLQITDVCINDTVIFLFFC